MIRYAVIADPHVHDCSWVPSGSALPGAIRSFADTAASTRVFNESVPAFRAALQQAAEAGVKLVLLVGDLTDDGQRPNVEAALAIIAQYRERFGLRVLATPGNHDLFALAGRPQAKNFLRPSGEAVLLDSADCPEARTLGTSPALGLMAGLGYQPEDSDLYWESPFGTDPAWEQRQYAVRSPDGRTACTMIDASYLVEPVAGLWVLSLDANVCVPRDGASDFDDPASFIDPTNGGWPAVVQHRPHLLEWMTGIAARARALGKTLVAFSHYPPLDVLGGASQREMALLGGKGLARRIPPAEVTAAFAATGVPLHFSGHLHVNDTARHDSGESRFINIAVPSPVGYGPALKLVEHEEDRISIRSLPLTEVEGSDRAYAAYQAEARQYNLPPHAASLSVNHGQFMDRHLLELVHERYLPREWPDDMVAFIRSGSMADLLTLLGLSTRLEEDFALADLAADFYRLRKGGELGRRDVGAARLAFYGRLCADVAGGQGDGLAGRFAELIGLLDSYMARLPNADCLVWLPGLEVTGLSAQAGARDEPSCATPLASAG